MASERLKAVPLAELVLWESALDADSKLPVPGWRCCSCPVQQTGGSSESKVTLFAPFCPLFAADVKT